MRIIVAEVIEAGPLRNNLLFKYENHRVYAITYEELFPLEWRLHAYRTISPWILPQQIESWRSYWREVSDGRYDAYLLELLTYLRSFDLAEYFEQSVCPKDARAQETTGSWAKRPETVVAHEMILKFPRPEALPPPVWNEAPGSKPSAEACDRFQAVCEETNRVNELIRMWNTAVKRGNYRISPIEVVPSFET